MVPSTAIADFEDVSINRYHWRIIVTAGMGFFTDAYDLFIIGVVTTILAPIWHLTTGQLALLNGASLAAAAAGAIFFGTLSDKFGRKKLYGIEVAILFFGAIFSAVSTSFLALMIARIVVGLGIGGDYPSSAVVASEHSPRARRGFMVLLVFAMQALGLVVGPLFASLLLSTHIPSHILWRILLGIGAVPAASVFYLRRRIQETPHHIIAQQTPLEVSRVIHDLTEHQDANNINEKFIESQKPRLWSKKWMICLLGTAGAWFLLDVAFYGNGISSVMIINKLSPHSDLLEHTLISALIFLAFAVPGYFAAAKYVDRIGRKPLQIFGFAMIALSYGIIALVPQITHIIYLFILVFGISFFFVNFGPNTTTFLIPSEIYPRSIRAKAHGISAAVGKLGAFVGAFFLPYVLNGPGMRYAMAIMSVVCLLGILTTFLVPESANTALSHD